MKASETSVRRKRVLAALDEQKLDCALVSSLPNIRYLSGFTGSNALLFLSAGTTILLTDPRYAIQAEEECDCRVRVAKGSLWRQTLPFIVRSRSKNIGFEAAKVTVDVYQGLHADLPLGAALQSIGNLIENERMVKSSEEISFIRKSVATCSQAFDRSLPTIRPGVSEAELSANIEYEMRRLGAEGPAFETIVAFGVRSALPHARPTNGLIGSNQLLLIDMGACRDGYASDMTRTLFIGRTTARARETYRAVLEAQLAAIAVVREGVTAESVDRAARRVLRTQGLAKAFVHSTGHGLGLEIHESPRIGKGDATPLRAGMVITIEPGAYLEGFGGVRIEDTVLVRPGGCEVLTPTNKEMLVL